MKREIERPLLLVIGHDTRRLCLLSIIIRTLVTRRACRGNLSLFQQKQIFLLFKNILIKLMVINIMLTIDILTCIIKGKIRLILA